MTVDAASKTPAKRACDACKVRKVRCSNTTPCAGCIAIGTPCTFNKQQGTRGPRRLKAKTIQHIAESQRPRDELTTPMVQAARQTPPVMDIGASPSPTSPTLHANQLPLPPLIASPPAASSPSEVGSAILTPVATLVLHLCVYRLRMFPVWPIVAVEDLMAALQKDNSGMEAYTLANAIAAATVVQARLDPLRNSAEVVTADSMEREAQRLGTMRHRKLNLHHVRIAFFLHVYHENLDPGGMKSLLYLRESITMAQIMGLHKESSYRDISPEDQQFRKRVVWLLFITERTIALLHRLPAILRLNISFPAMEYDKDVSILPAFRRIVKLYWTLDQSEVFDILQNSRHSSSTPSVLDQNKLCLLQKKLQDITIDSSATNDVQAADLCVTRAWMCALIWRVADCDTAPQSNERTTSISYPIKVSKELLEQISNLPSSAVEAHGLSIELKIYDIACSVVDSIAKLESDKSAQREDLNPREILNRLQNILSTCRGGNNTLVNQISDRLAKIQCEPLVFSENEGGHDISGDSGGTRRHSEQPVAFVSNTQVGDNDIMRSFSSVVLDPYHGSPDYSQVSQPMTFSWDSITAETQAHFGSSVEQMDESAAIDNFLNQTMHHTNHLIRRSHQHPVNT